MKKLALMLSGFCLVAMVGCKKNTEQLTPEVSKSAKLYNVNFNVGGFSETNRPFDNQTQSSAKVSAAPTTSTTLINKLYYVIADANGVITDTLLRDVKGQINTASLKLAAGNYTLRLGGFNTNSASFLTYGIGFSKTNANLTFYYFESFSHRSYDTKDIFVGGMSFAVASDTSYNAITLNRLSAKVEVNVVDKLASNVKYAEVTAASPTGLTIYNQGSNNTLTGSGSPVSYIVDLSGYAGKENQVFAVSMLPANQLWSTLSEQTTNVKLNFYDANNTLLMSKDIPNVKIKSNTITRLSGNLNMASSTTKQSGFPVNINEDWSATTITQSF